MGRRADPGRRAFLLALGAGLVSGCGAGDLIASHPEADAAGSLLDEWSAAYAGMDLERLGMILAPEFRVGDVDPSTGTVHWRGLAEEMASTASLFELCGSGAPSLRFSGRPEVQSRDRERATIRGVESRLSLEPDGLEARRELVLETRWSGSRAKWLLVQVTGT